MDGFRKCWREFCIFTVALIYFHRGTEIGWVEMLKILGYTAYSCSVSNCPAPNEDNVCGSQPSRWLPEIPTSWGSHTCISPSHIISREHCIRDGMQLLRLGYKKTTTLSSVSVAHSFSISLSNNSFLRK